MFKHSKWGLRFGHRIHSLENIDSIWIHIDKKDIVLLMNQWEGYVQLQVVLSYNFDPLILPSQSIKDKITELPNFCILWDISKVTVATFIANYLATFSFHPIHTNTWCVINHLQRIQNDFKRAKGDRVSKQYPNFVFLSQPNNNHNPNNKTTITVVGLRLSNRWEYHPHPPPPPPTTTQTQNCMIEQI